MSLDFTLYGKDPYQSDPYIAQGYVGEENTELFSTNITHNLSRMAREAGIQEVLWQPREHGYNKARQIVTKLREGLKDLKNRREHFEKFNASNGWGRYEGFVASVETILAACEEYPEAFIDADI
jgi:hypothetical protein